MHVVCSWCKPPRRLREVEPLDDQRETHGLCEACAEMVNAQAFPPADFDEASHEYKIGGARVPSVTEIIRDVLPGWEAAEWYLQRGRAMHHGCRLIAEGRDLDPASVDPAIAGRLDAFRKFLKDSGAIVLEYYCELPMVHSQLRYGGKIDGMLMLQGGRVLADWKSTIVPQVRVQLGGYAELLAANGMPVSRAVAVELRDDGTFRCEWMGSHALRRHGQGFRNCLGAYNLRRECGVRVS